MPYQCKREPLNDDEINRIANACDTLGEKFIIWALLDTGSGLSEFPAPNTSTQIDKC